MKITTFTIAAFAAVSASYAQAEGDLSRANVIEVQRLIPFSPVAPHVDAAQNLALVA